MITLTINVDSISTALEAFDVIQIKRYTGTDVPEPPVTNTDAVAYYTTVSGTDTISSRTGVSDVLLNASYSQYYFDDDEGNSSSWYISRYYHTTTSAASGWSDPVPGYTADLYYSPQFPEEEDYETAEQLIIDRIRLLIGDPLGIAREFGEDAVSSIHQDGKTYELDEKGWPIYITIGGVQYNCLGNPTVNGYKYLRFNCFVDDVCTTCSGYEGDCGEDVYRDVVTGPDIWYHTFRFSDKEIKDAYDTCYPPTPLTTTTANSEVYMVQTAIDLLRSELWEDATEDGADIKDEGSHYNPDPGLKIRRDLLKDLTKRRDDLVKALQLTGIAGVLID